MMTMDVMKPDLPSATAGMGGGGGGGGAGAGGSGANTASMSLGGLVPTGSQQTQSQQQQQQQQQTLGNQAAGGGPSAGGSGGGSGGGGGGTRTQQPQLCAGCGKHIQDRFLLNAIDLLWHEDCLKCGCCDCRLGEVGASLYTKGNLVLCKRDYLRLFGNTGFCAACNKVIPAFEMVMRARNNVYHLECFACQQCNHRFCVGDKFYLCENKILCEYDYEERLVFASMANLPMMRRQMAGGSGGAGSSNAGMQNGHGSGGGTSGVGNGGAGSQMQPGQGMGSPQQNGANGNPALMRGGGGAGGATAGAVGGGDLNNNSNSLTAALAGGPSPFGTPAHIKAALNSSS